MDANSGEQIYQQAAEAVEFIKQSLPEIIGSPKVGIICGSGLGGLANAVNSSTKVTIPFADIPHFGRSTVQGHAGTLLFGNLGRDGKPVVMMVGRLHFYEGHSIQQTTFPIRVMKLLGINTLIVTNAAGGLASKLAVGDLVVVNDHLNLAGLSGCHPLRGPNVDLFGPRFPPLSDAYNLDLRRQTHQAWKGMGRRGRTLHEGVYAFVGGPSYETRAECRLLHKLGADVVEAGPLGSDDAIASLGQEALRQLDEGGKAAHGEVLEAGRQAASDMETLVQTIVRGLP